MKTVIKLIFVSFLFIFLSYFDTISFHQDTEPDNSKIEKIEKSILYKGSSDSLETSDIFRDSTILPGSYNLPFSKMQDSAYFSALRLKIPTSTRFYHDLKLFSFEWQMSMTNNGPTIDQLANQSIQDLPDKYFQASGTEIAMHQYNIYQSQFVPYVPTMKPFGLKVSLDAIGSFLGMTEDLSPTISYSLYETAHVELVIYSVQAIVIATIFSGRQVPGNYRYKWNGRNDKGMKMSSGDYVGEVRIGKNRYIRKRIYIP